MRKDDWLILRDYFKQNKPDTLIIHYRSNWGNSFEKVRYTSSFSIGDNHILCYERVDDHKKISYKSIFEVYNDGFDTPIHSVVSEKRQRIRDTFRK